MGNRQTPPLGRLRRGLCESGRFLQLGEVTGIDHAPGQAVAETLAAQGGQVLFAMDNLGSSL